MRSSSGRAPQEQRLDPTGTLRAFARTWALYDSRAATRADAAAGMAHLTGNRLGAELALVAAAACAVTAFLYLADPQIRARVRPGHRRRSHAQCLDPGVGRRPLSARAQRRLDVAELLSP